MRNRIKMGKGFTLIEMLAVVVIIVIILFIALPNILQAIYRSNKTACAGNIENAKKSIYSCFADTKDADLCDSWTELVPAAGSTGTPSYMESVPVCPVNKSTLYVIVRDSVTNMPTIQTSNHFPKWPDTKDHTK